MSRPDYDAGDLVVCVDDGIIGCSQCHHTGAAVERGAVYRVSGFQTGQCGCVAAVIDRARLVDPATGVPRALASRFRKVDPLPASLTALLTETPARTPVSA